jgi:hypothetical protein
MSKSHGPRQAVTVLLQGKREERSRTVPAEEMSMNPNPVVINLAFSCVYHLTAPPFSKTRKIFLTRNTKKYHLVGDVIENLRCHVEIYGLIASCQL